MIDDPAHDAAPHPMHFCSPSDLTTTWHPAAFPLDNSPLASAIYIPLLPSFTDRGVGAAADAPPYLQLPRLKLETCPYHQRLSVLIFALFEVVNSGVYAGLHFVMVPSWENWFGLRTSVRYPVAYWR
jgi:hypothetical protein